MNEYVRILVQSLDQVIERMIYAIQIIGSNLIVNVRLTLLDSVRQLTDVF